ncbi:phosphate ABC transporter permease PstA [Syntrophomonas palmitatica]|uniref:phosphate ABC transporter permease PstA n=1 Tax=Syntrophomonas palmitatica TaxID=402877 RepID=UPI0006D1BE13|nr:phosphate ABC transporter permease PstA [Syntrophomonas palmitatica]
MPNNKWGERLLTIGLWLSALLITGILLSIIGYIVYRGAGSVNMDFILHAPGRAGKEGGISTTIVSTVYLTLMALLIAVPLGVGTAVYLEEYTKKRSRFAYLINLTTETLAGVPSIIFGLFGFVFFVIFMGLGWSIISGSMTLAIMILPTITRTSQEAILAVPNEYRENSLALGATRWQTVHRVVLPPAIPGITTGIILSIGRAVGETAAVILTAGSSLNMPVALSDPARSMAVHLYILAMEGLSVERAFGTAFLIIILVLVINAFANLSIRRLANIGT